MKKLLILMCLMFFITNSVFAETLKGGINNAISQSKVNKNAISIVIKDIQNGKTVYSLNPNMPVSPASVQKIITLVPAVETLGQDYKFTTKLYKNKNNEFLIKLGADPYLSSKDLNKIVKYIPKEPKEIYIDDSIIDNNEWGEGWQWDDDLNELMPKFSAYNLDRNLIELVITPTIKGFSPEITLMMNYPTTFINNMITDVKTKYTLKRQNYLSPDIIVADGTIALNTSDIRKIPVNCPKRYFILRLSDIVIDNNISVSGNFNTKKLDKNYTLITQISHDLSNAKIDILKNSNNMISETVFKLAGGKYVNETGSFENGLKMLEDYCKKQNIDTSDIKIVDASGVSKNNLMTTNFITEFLQKNQELIEPYCATAGEGTLKNRMLFLKGFLRAKTGTLTNISTISGYISTKKNRKYVFSIMINDSKTKSSDKKILEEYILRSIYQRG